MNKLARSKALAPVRTMSFWHTAKLLPAAPLIKNEVMISLPWIRKISSGIGGLVGSASVPVANLGRYHVASIVVIVVSSEVIIEPTLSASNTSFLTSGFR